MLYFNASKKVRGASLIFIIVLVLLTVTKISDAADKVMWKGYSFISTASHIDYKNLQAMATEFTKISNGLIQTQTSQGRGHGISASSVTQAVGDGVLTFAHDGFYHGNIPIAGLMALPLLFPTHDDFVKGIEILIPYLEAGLDKKGVKLLATYNFPLQTIWTTVKCTSLDDIRGLKLRVKDSNQGAFVKAFGGFPVAITASEVATALQRGVIQGGLTASVGGGIIHVDFWKYNYRLGLNYDLMLILVNKKAFYSLPKDIQPKIIKIAKKYAENITKELSVSEDEKTKIINSKGVVITVPDSSTYKTAGLEIQDYWDKWAKNLGPNAIECLKKVRKTIDR